MIARIALLIICAFWVNVPSAFAEKKAVLICFSAYSWKALPSVVTDCDNIRALLREDYKLTEINDHVKNWNDFHIVWDKFVDNIAERDDILVYYAGHGLDVNGLNYLLPVSAPQPTSGQNINTAAHDFILLRDLVRDVQQRTSSTIFFVIDACRSNPYKDTRGAAKPKGLSQEVIQKFSGYTMIYFSTDFDHDALDSIPGRPEGSGSPFAMTFAQLYPVGRRMPLFIFLQEVTDGVQRIVLPQEQIPTPQGYWPRQLCLTSCDARYQNMLQITFTSMAAPANGRAASSRVALNTLVASAPSDGVAAGPRDVASLKALGNVIFLGKRSQQNCHSNEFSDEIPFGCDLLKSALSVAGADGQVKAASLQDVTALTDVNVRRSAPKVEDGRAVYDCSVGVIRRGQQIKLLGLAAYQYVGDLFLWGIIDAPQMNNCKPN